MKKISIQGKKYDRKVWALQVSHTVKVEKWCKVNTTMSV